MVSLTHSQLYLTIFAIERFLWKHKAQTEPSIVDEKDSNKSNYYLFIIDFYMAWGCIKNKCCYWLVMQWARVVFELEQGELWRGGMLLAKLSGS